VGSGRNCRLFLQKVQTVMFLKEKTEWIPFQEKGFIREYRSIIL